MTPPASPAQQPAGERPKKPFWKKKRFIIPAAIVAFFVIVGACSGGARQQSGTSIDPAPTSTAAPTPADTAAAPPATSAPPAAPPAPAPPAVQTATFNGVGDDIVTIDLGGNPGVITFQCPTCSRNTVLQTNGRDSLLVNTIGAYQGSHLVDMQETSNTTELTIRANSAWTVTVADVSTAPRTAGAATGSGDGVVFMEANTNKATITYTGERNFTVHGYGGTRRELAVNEIGSYQGTVRLTLPGYVQVNSSGDWTITPG